MQNIVKKVSIIPFDKFTFFPEDDPRSDIPIPISTFNCSILV